ncbi:MAG TPA: CofH family radical SAM protein [Acidobacteriota bacterium]|nr:CofH family radical SAM protein [Acidobacteriota bacterium]
MTIWQSGRSDYILEKALDGKRISAQEALELYDDADFLKVISAARVIRNRKNDPSVVTYTMFRVVNYTTFCNVDCSFCSFAEPMGSSRGTVLSPEEIVQKMREAVAIGAEQMFLQGGVNPDLPFSYYLDVIRGVKETLGNHIHVRAFSPVELLGMQQQTGMPLRRILRELKAAGMDSVPGAGAEILSERVRGLLSPRKAPAAEWVRVMETCHQEGLPGSANIVFGSEETHAEVVEHLGIVRDLQDRTGGFLTFIPWTFQQQTKRFRTRTVPSHEFLKVLGICRIFLDNIPHIETSVMVLGQGVGSLALHAGADDISSVVIEENVLKSYGLKTEEKAREFIRESGFTPVKRDLLYHLQEHAS